MPISFATLQVYNHYLTTYDNKRTSRSHIHDRDELRHIYSDIQLKNRFAPLYLTEPTPSAIAYAVQLKESAETLKATITTFGSSDKQMLFSSKKAYSDNPELVQVDYTASSDKSAAPEHFHLEIKEFASPQVNESSYLTADQPVLMPSGNYSFDVITNKLHYELQFAVNEGETHEQLQNKLARLINYADIGIHAEVLHDREAKRSALQITSEALGLPVQGEHHFEITDDNTSHTNGIVHYLGLNKTIHNAKNATYYIDGKERSSYSNSFPVYGNYRLTLNEKSSVREADIGLYPDIESLSYNIEGFVDCYNQFLHGIEHDENAKAANNQHLLSEMKKLIGRHKGKIEKYGIGIQEDNTLQYLRDDSLSKMPDLDSLQTFGNQVLRKLHAIALDPMEYVSRAICAYSNPATSYVNPYVTSIYSGMLFNSYC